MDKQKLVEKNTFPLIDAILQMPQEGTNGNIAICTNTSSPGQVLNEIPEDLRKYICILGTLIVSRDGGERMIINSLSHKTLKYLILFSEESNTFCPSTNLLQALMNGFDLTQTGNYINDGVGASYHYPNINAKIFEEFKEEIIVLPMFAYKNEKSKNIIENYLKWLENKIPKNLLDELIEINKKDKIYYDSLKMIIKTISNLKENIKKPKELDPKDFQHLQPPKIYLDVLPIKFNTSFKVSRKNKSIRVDLKIISDTYFIIGDDPFLICYSIMKELGDKKKYISPTDQILLGAEIGRVNTEILNEVQFPSFILDNEIIGDKEIKTESNIQLKMDQRYYYKINSRDKKISVMCLSFDVCESVFELLSNNLPEMIDRISRENRFENYEMDILHRMDIGVQLGKAAIASKLGYSFIQDFSLIFKINKENLPTTIIDGDSFLDVHKGVLRSIYTLGITEEHGDSWKGLARTSSILAIYRKSNISLEKIPAIYRQGDQSGEEVREKYKQQLLRKDHDGSYSYGERTRTYFGFDQLEKTIEILKNNSKLATIIQRFDPATDMGTYIDISTGKQKFTHDPCLTHDIFFIQNDKLNSFHIARAHNAVNAYPENIFGLFDAYISTIQKELNIPFGDMYMLSNRANILLLTEEQRTKKILSEPSKPVGDIDTKSGPYKLNTDNNLNTSGGVAYYFDDIVEIKEKPKSKILEKLEDYEGVNTIEKSINYLKEKGVIHNNPVMSEYYTGKSDPQGDNLVFLQINVYGGKVYATAVFANRSIDNLSDDKKLISYIATLFSTRLNALLGKLSIYYVAYK